MSLRLLITLSGARALVFGTKEGMWHVQIDATCTCAWVQRQLLSKQAKHSKVSVGASVHLQKSTSTIWIWTALVAQVYQEAEHLSWLPAGGSAAFL